MNFKNLEKCDVLKNAKKSSLIKSSSVWCLLKSARPVYCQLHFALLKTSLKTTFL